MAHKNVDYKPEDIQFPNQKIVQSELVHEMQSSYIEYAMSVIVGRALPDVRDGLKPVHRRILYAMYEDGLTSDKAFKKSATCVGDVLGRYHPHGDASVYDALVRLAQDFSMRYMLVDGHGNFGSIDGDPPAAYRYTEARMSKIANEMLRDIDKETVDWDPNFDESRKEPRVLPARFPNLLVNGSSGIAVGMATNIPPHNLTEVINACVCVLDNPEATLYDLMQHVTGPDFPTKGIIMGRSGIRAAYATGRGKIILRARTEFEEFGRDRTRIIVTELPYQVNKRMLIKNMADQVEDKRLEGISDIRDESDRNGMRMVIELKRDANPQVVLNRLFSQSQLQTTFSINMLALVDNQHQPKILSLRHIIDEYLAFQEEIIVRRTRYDLKDAQARAHLLEGLLIAQDNIDEVIKTPATIRDPDAATAKPALERKNWNGEVEFKDVSFRYPGSDEDALEHISFTARPGETTAIIGSTGCGKSTLLNLIPRFYDVTEGSVTIDGVDVRDMTQAQLHDELGYVPQKGVLFSGTITSNLKFGGDHITDADAEQAAEIAQATEFISAKPEGFDSPIAQGGSNVSGGQKQRLSIARAIAKHPQIYLFDDSFSALDYKTDVALRRALKAKTDNATVIIVAQRISTVLHANQILVLDEGRIVGKGTHAQLMESCPAYQEIARSQLSQKELNLQKEGE